MDKRRRMIAWWSLIPLLFIAGLTGSAFACTAQASMSIDPTSGPSGSTTTATGRSFDESPVELRWDSKNGQLLATAQGPTFTTSLRIPEAPSGVHYIVATSTSSGHVARAAFEVTSEATKTTTTAAEPSDSSTTTTTSHSEPSSSGGSSGGSDTSGSETTTGNPPQEATSTGAQDPPAPPPPSAFPSPPSEGTTGSKIAAIGSKSAGAPSTTAGGEVGNIPTTLEDETTTTTTEDEDEELKEDDRELALQPTPARSGWGPGAVGGLLALGGLLSLAGVVVGRKIGRRQPAELAEPVEPVDSEGGGPDTSV